MALETILVKSIKKDYSFDFKDPIKLLYISNADLYKHQWKVIRAAEKIKAIIFH